MKKNPPPVLRTLLRALLGPLFFERLMLARHLGYWPHIRHPRSFNEKTAHLKLFLPHTVPARLVDKWAVREWVAERVGEKYLNAVFGVYERSEDIDFSRLPEQVVLKATHGSAMNVIVRGREGGEADAVRRTCRRFLGQRYGWNTNESWYADVPPRIMAERYIEQSGRTLPDDYRFFVFGGKMAFVEVDCNRKTDKATNTNLDRKWNVMPFVQHPPVDPHVPRPECWEEMVAVAETLGAGFPFVRVDLYCPDGKTILFGEMTFAHAAGWSPFLPDSFHDFALGGLWVQASGDRT